MSRFHLPLLICVFALATAPLDAQESEEPKSVEEIQKSQEELHKQIEEQQRELESLKREVRQQRGGFGLFAPFNPKISLDGLFAGAFFSEKTNLNQGDHDPRERGFNVQNVELSLQAPIDPYFTAEGHLIFFLEDGETKVELEEAFMTTTSLPFNLQVLGGQFFTRFGRLNPLHPHAWQFADQPVILNRLFGPDGLRGPGVQVSYLVPTPLYLEILGSVQQPFGETATSFFFEKDKRVGGFTLGEGEVQNVDDLIYMSRLATSFDLSPSVTTVWGTSILLGSNSSGPDNRTIISGTDLFLKWRPITQSAGFPFVAWQTEFLFRDYEAGPGPGEGGGTDRLKDWGIYTELSWGFVRRWVTGVRLDYADARGGGAPRADDLRSERWRISPTLTFYPTEFSKIRLQYNADWAESRGRQVIHALFLQFEFAMGEHPAHKF